MVGLGLVVVVVGSSSCTSASLEDTMVISNVIGRLPADALQETQHHPLLEPGACGQGWPPGGSGGGGGGGGRDSDDFIKRYLGN